jgi:hypothetical protein
MDIEFSEGAEAGLKQILTGDSGCPLLRLTQHEVTDLALSGRAFGTIENRDGTTTMVEIIDTSGELWKIADLWRKDGTLRSL